MVSGWLSPSRGTLLLQEFTYWVTGVGSAKFEVSLRGGGEPSADRLTCGCQRLTSVCRSLQSGRSEPVVNPSWSFKPTAARCEVTHRLARTIATRAT